MSDDSGFAGTLLTQAFAARELPDLLARKGLFPRAPERDWPTILAGLREFAGAGGPVRVRHHILDPLARAWAWQDAIRQDPIETREGPEDGGYLLTSGQGPRLRVWPLGRDADLDTPKRQGTAARVSPPRMATRVLRARGERIGLLTNGDELRLLLCDPAGPDGHMSISLTDWLRRQDVPESYRIAAALASPDGVAALPEIFDAARLHQTSVTRALRVRARAAIEDFLAHVIAGNGDLPSADVLWRQALTIVYRLLFVLKLESSAEPGRGFSFAASSTWRHALSPNRALGPLVRRHLDLGHDTGGMLEGGLRALFQICREGLVHTSLSIAPLGGRLFDPEGTRDLDALRWGERASALLLDRLLWTSAHERVHYGALDVEVLGSIYESLLDLEPDIATAPMTRTRHGRVEAVVPAGEDAENIIAPGTFFLRTGLGRRSGGSYYTPNEFVRHLVRDSLAPMVSDKDPAAILAIKVIDPAMGSGHFLVEACRFLAEALYDSCCRLDAAGTTEAIDALPDPDKRLAAYLPSRSRDRAESGPSRAHALAICRRLVAVHCLYGIDRDPRAVELARVSLWLESFAEGMPLTFLDHRLIAGDSIGGPFTADLARLPVGGGALDPLLARGVADRLQDLAHAALTEIRGLEASIGTSLADMIAKQRAKARLDRCLDALRSLARAWSGAVRTRARGADDAWLALARAVAETGEIPADLHPHQAALLHHGGDALPLDLIFPDVFRPDLGEGGFHAVLGNPPWDVVHYQTKEFLAAFDPLVMDAPTKREREAIENDLLADPAIRAAFERYKQDFVERKRLCDRLFPRLGSAGSIDLFQIFTERMLDCRRPDGVLGVVVPSAIHANEGTAPLRRRLLDENRLENCFTFENRRKLFDIHSRLKFTLLTARRGGATKTFQCGFYLDSIAGLADPDKIMTYDRAFVDAVGGPHGTFLELRGPAELRLARTLFVGRETIGPWMARQGIEFGREAHMTDDSHRFVRAGAPHALPLHEGKTFHQFTDRWKAPPRYAIPLAAMEDKPRWLRAAAHYRLVFREIARSTDDRTMIAAMLPPGHVIGHKGTCEKAPWARPHATALILAAIFNSFVFDWCVRQRTAASVSLFMLNGCPAPALTKGAARFLAHGALRLICRHTGYADLWKNQMGSLTGFLVSFDQPRLRAAMDAVLARAYGLNREDYQRVLAGFSHKVNPDAPRLCLDAFDECSAAGTAAFFRRHDPFDKVPLAIDKPTASATLIPSIPADNIPPAYPAPSPAG